MIFFDIDNTLLDNDTAQASAAMVIYGKYRKLQALYSEKKFPGIWNEAADRYVKEYEQGRLTFLQQRQERINEIFKGSLNKEEADMVLADYIASYGENWQLYPDVMPVLERYKNTPKGIISNGDKDAQRQKLHKTGIAHYFDIIVISEDIGVFKPDPEIFLHAVRQAGKEPAQCLYIGDKVDTDAKAAKDAGLTGIWLNRKFIGEKTERVPEIISLNDLSYSSR